MHQANGTVIPNGLGRVAFRKNHQVQYVELAQPIVAGFVYLLEGEMQVRPNILRKKLGWRSKIELWFCRDWLQAISRRER
jgi:hypothetical protein